MTETIDYEAIKNKVLSYSSLKEFRKSPEHFLEYMFGPKKTSDAFDFGNLVDKMILTPDSWRGDVVVMIDKPPTLKSLVEALGNKEGDAKYRILQAEFNTWIAENNGKLIVSKDEMATAELIANKVWKNRAAKDILERVKVTQEHFQYTDKKTGLKIRGFKDAKGDGFIMDLKTTQNADPDEFIRSAIKYDYPLQGGVYVESEKQLNYEFPDYYFLCVEKSPPYGISVLKASDDFINLGKKQLRETLDNFKWALDNLMFNESYEFKSQITGWHSLELPGWIKHKLNNED